MTRAAPRTRHPLFGLAVGACTLASALVFGCSPGGGGGGDGGGGGGGAPMSSGGAGPGGSPSGGGGAAEVSFMLGADISSVPEQVDLGAVYIDTDGVEKPMPDLLADHGFNYVRLRTFVDPAAPFGYATGDGGAACVKAAAYCDLDHTLEFAKEIKAAGLGFLLDFHYSDNWADPGKQIIPEAWRDAETIEELADYVREYTRDAIDTLIAGGARPDIVQIGNEVTPGMLIHVPTNNTDCWGNGSARNELNGSTANWDNLALLLQAGLDGVREVDPTIRTMVHLENTDHPAGAIAWMDRAQQFGLDFDILGMSCYPAYQGPPSVWAETFGQLAQSFPELSFVVAEYGPEPRAVIDVVSNIPDGRGLGAFLWEPTLSGSWGRSLFTMTSEGYRANDEDFAVYDDLRVQLGL